MAEANKATTRNKIKPDIAESIRSEKIPIAIIQIIAKTLIHANPAKNFDNFIKSSFLVFLIYEFKNTTFTKNCQ